METRNCQSCKIDFKIEKEDFDYYSKIKVPPPTWCPDCRFKRRMVWRNERSLFRRQNGTPGATSEHISIYHPEAKITTYDKEYWWSDKWDARDYGRDYDFSRPFFEQFKELLESVPHIMLFDSKSVNSRFCNVTVEMKNSYMVSATWATEDSMYCNRLWYCKYTHDSYLCFNTEYCYENVYCVESNKLFFSRESEGCLDSYFLYDCKNCSNCILSTNLRNKSYCIENVQYTKEEYFKKKAELGLDTRKGIENAKKRFEELWKNAIHKHLKLTNNVNVVGDQVTNSRNAYMIFDFKDDAENVKYANWGSMGLKDSYDVGPGCGDHSELNYEGTSIGVNNSRTFFDANVWYSRDVHYSYIMNNCSNCFGCSEMNAKEYCILNKQYTKEEYEVLLPKVIQHMKDMPYVDKKGRVYTYGEFFPPEISPFAFNESTINDYFPMSKEEAVLEGHKWRDYVPNAYKTTIKGSDLPETIGEVDDSITKEVIECEVSKRPFQILEQELSFYKRFNLPLPSVHPDERHKRRLKLRNPLVLRKRNCYLCDKEVDTTYLPEEEGGPIKVLCTQDYNKEVY